MTGSAEKRSYWKRHWLWIVILVLIVIIAVIGGTVGGVLGGKKSSSASMGNGYFSSSYLFSSPQSEDVLKFTPIQD